MHGRSVGRTIFFLAFIVLLGAGAFYVDLPNTPGIHIGGYNNALPVKEGLDLKGGIQLVMQASCPTAQPHCSSSYIDQNMAGVISNINRRVSQGLGLNDATVRQESNGRVLIQLPGLTDDQQARQLLGKTGDMNIIETGYQQLPVNTVVTPGQYKVAFVGSQLDSSSIQAGLDQNGKPIVQFAFSGNAKSAFATYTRDNINQFLTITLDNKVIESAQIISEIDGQGQITGLTSIGDAQSLATYLKYGALPLPLTVASEQQLAATLGQQAIAMSLRAAMIGLGMVVLFMLIYYRLPGLMADVALLLYSGLLFAVIKLLGATLSLAGIAAIILTIGMAVDANILIFERMKEELRAGRTMAAAVDLGFKRAWPSIRDSNASTLITAFILYLFGNNFGATIIVGFAINLAIGVLISLFTAVVVTRNFLQLLLISGVATHPALYGLPKRALNLPHYRPSERRAAAASRRPGLAFAGAGAPLTGGTTVEADGNADNPVDEALDPPTNDTTGTNGTTVAAARSLTTSASHGAEE